MWSSEMKPVQRVRYVIERAVWDEVTRLSPGETIRLPAEWWPVFYDKQKATGKLPSWVKRDAPPDGQIFNGHPILWVPRSDV